MKLRLRLGEKWGDCGVKKRSWCDGGEGEWLVLGSVIEGVVVFKFLTLASEESRSVEEGVSGWGRGSE